MYLCPHDSAHINTHLRVQVVNMHGQQHVAREGCRTVEPPYGKFDGFLHCECYMAGTIAGVVFPWVCALPLLYMPDVLAQVPTPSYTPCTC